MAVDIKKAVEDAAETTVETGVRGADLLSGTAATVADSVSRAVTHPVREARKLERRGAQANKRLSHDVAELFDDTEDAIEAVMPEKVALLGIHAIKRRARRTDLIGDVAYRTLEVINGGLETVLRTLNFENATEPPVRPAAARGRSASPARRSTKTRATGRIRRTARRRKTA